MFRFQPSDKARPGGAAGFASMPKTMRRVFILLRAAACAAPLLLVACASTSPKLAEWPAGLPPLAFYEDIYEADIDNQRFQSRGEYLLWVIRFYKGWTLYEDGWEMISARVSADIEDPARRTQLETKLADLGRVVSSEWAKDSPNRLIFTRHIAAWGQALQESVNRGEQEDLVTRVEQDVRALFGGTLNLDSITYERYYGMEDDAFF